MRGRLQRGDESLMPWPLLEKADRGFTTKPDIVDRRDCLKEEGEFVACNVCISLGRKVEAGPRQQELEIVPLGRQRLLKGVGPKRNFGAQRFSRVRCR
jgi:hypothetical protein